MGSIKNSQTAAQDHVLSEQEFNYVMNVQTAKQAIADEYNRVMSAFLKYVSTTRLGYQPADDLQFELDFTDNKHTLKVTILPKNES